MEKVENAATWSGLQSNPTALEIPKHGQKTFLRLVAGARVKLPLTTALVLLQAGYWVNTHCSYTQEAVYLGYNNGLFLFLSCLWEGQR